MKSMYLLNLVLHSSCSNIYGLLNLELKRIVVAYTSIWNLHLFPLPFETHHTDSGKTKTDKPKSTKGMTV